MLAKRIKLLLLLIMLCVAGRPLSQAQAQGSSGPVVEVGDSRLTITWSPPSYKLDTLELEGERYSQLHLAGLSSAGLAGQPDLPLYGSLIGLPPTGTAQLRIVEVERETVHLPDPPVPVPVPQPVHLSPTELDPASTPVGPTKRYPDPGVYENNAFYPEVIAELGPPQQLRNRRVAVLTIHPLRVNPVSEQMEVIRFLRLEIAFSDPAPLSSLQAAADSFSQALAATLLNPEAAHWPGATKAELAQADLMPAATANSLKVLVDQPGLYALTYQALQNAGLPIDSLDPRTLRLSHGYPRQEVATRVEGEGDGVFNPADRLLFYAEPTFSRFVNHDVYFLSYGETMGLRMTSRSGSPSGKPAGWAWRTASAELNKFYDPLYPGRDGDHWYWAKLFQPNATSGSYTLQLEEPLTSGPKATLTLWLQGYTDPSQNPDHKVRVTVNGTFVGEQTWNGAIAMKVSFPISSGVLKNGANQIKLSLPGTGTTIEGMWLDALAMEYPTGQASSGQLRFRGEANPKSYSLSGWSTSNLSVYDITNPDMPQWVTGYQRSGATLSIGDLAAAPATYLVVPGNTIKSPLALQAARVLNDPAGGADYIIITPGSLSSAIAPLAHHRASSGLRVATVNVEKIYDAFGAGRLDPEAIKNFLKYAYTNWPKPTPLYVLLVGDGSYDFKNYSSYQAPTLIPPYLAQVDPWWGETASDNQFVTLSGADNLPELLIGRLTANTAAETTTIVNKIIQYETHPALGNWNAWQLLVADNPDNAGNFHMHAEAAYAEIEPPFIGRRFYYSPTQSSQAHLYTNVNILRSDLLNAFKSGSSLVTFYGHSSWLQWAVEDLFDVTTVEQLNNGGRLPVVLEMTCFTGFFHHPAYPNTLDETLLRHSGGGAVAVWGSTGLGISTGHDALQAGFYQAFAAQDPIKLGAAVLAGKLRVSATGLNLDLLDTYTLFGDPALTLTPKPANYTNFVYLPLLPLNNR